MPTTRIDRLIERQSRDLAGLHDREARRFLRTFDAARRELAELLDELTLAGQDETTPYTAQHVRVMLAQLDAAARTLRRRLGEELDEAVERQQRAAWDSLVQVVRRMDSEFRAAAGAIEIEALRRMTEAHGLLLHRYSLHRYESDLVDLMQRELTAGLARGLTVRQLRARLAGPGGVIDGMRPRAELIVRMELNSAFNRYHDEAIAAAAETLDAGRPPGDPDRMRRRANEHVDLRNHAISRVLDGMVVDIDEPFRAPRSDVVREHEVLQAARAAAGLPRRRLGGIVWPLDGAEYVGQTYPAHYWERGRVIPWRASWGQSVVVPTGVAVATGARTTPSMAPDASRAPRGKRKNLRKSSDALQRETLRMENSCALWLARHGFDVKQLPETGGGHGVRRPDMLIEGRVFDHIAPASGAARFVPKRLRTKARNGQATRFIVDVRRWRRDVLDELWNVFTHESVGGIDEVVVFDGRTMRWVVG